MLPSPSGCCYLRAVSCPSCVTDFMNMFFFPGSNIVMSTHYFCFSSEMGFYFVLSLTYLLALSQTNSCNVFSTLNFVNKMLSLKYVCYIRVLSGASKTIKVYPCWCRLCSWSTPWVRSIFSAPQPLGICLKCHNCKQKS